MTGESRRCRARRMEALGHLLVEVSTESIEPAHRIDVCSRELDGRAMLLVEMPKGESLHGRGGRSFILLSWRNLWGGVPVNRSVGAVLRRVCVCVIVSECRQDRCDGAAGRERRAVVPDPVVREPDGGSAGWIAVDADGGCWMRVRLRGNTRSSLAEGLWTVGNAKKGGAAACEAEDLD